MEKILSQVIALGRAGDEGGDFLSRVVARSSLVASATTSASKMLAPLDAQERASAASKILLAAHAYAIKVRGMECHTSLPDERRGKEASSSSSHAHEMLNSRLPFG